MVHMSQIVCVTKQYMIDNGMCYKSYMLLYDIAIKWYMLLNGTSQNGICYQADHFLNGTQYNTNPPHPMALH
jgi:hypothetical protein